MFYDQWRTVCKIIHSTAVNLKADVGPWAILVPFKSQAKKKIIIIIAAADFSSTNKLENACSN